MEYEKSIVCKDLLGFFHWAHLGTVGPRLSALCRPSPCSGTPCCKLVVSVMIVIVV